MKRFTTTTSSVKDKRLSVRLISLFIAAVMTATIWGGTAAVVSASKSTDSKVKKFESEIAAIESQMASLKTQIIMGKSDIEKTIAEKEVLDKEMNLLIQKIDVTNSLIEELSNSISEKNTEISNKELAYQNKYELFKERLRVTREDGRANYLEMLFGATSLADFLARIDRIGSMMEYDVKIMNGLKRDKADLESAKNIYEIQKSEQEEYLAALEADEAALESKRIEAANFLTKLESNQAYYNSLYEKALAAEEQLQKELQAYLKELEAQQNTKYVGGEFMWPVPQKYVRVSSEYGGRYNPISGKYETHNGIDIPAAYGTDIYASNDGTVTIATTHWSYGNYIMIDHGGGYATLYAHASKLLVKKGDKVKKGQVIAKVGSTGYSTGNHLHFSMYENSAHTNPRKWFPA